MRVFLSVVFQMTLKVLLLYMASWFLYPILTFKQIVGIWFLFRFAVWDTKGMLREVLHDSRSN